MQIVRDPRELRNTLDDGHRHTTRVSLVPTMGALHEGHVSLLRNARKRADIVVASIYVNPAQFGPGEDFDHYPRDTDRDLALLCAEGVDIAYLPEDSAMYSPCFVTYIVPRGPALGLESDARPEFFSGVATVVLKLLLQVAPDDAFFGEKDYQQLIVVRRLVEDLDLPTRIVSGATVREADGLAMSSRNVYLDAIQRPRAATLYSILQQAVQEIEQTPHWKKVLVKTERRLATGFDAVDYLALRDADSLSDQISPGQACRLLAAVHLGTTRLIDNVPVKLFT